MTASLLNSSSLFITVILYVVSKSGKYVPRINCTAYDVPSGVQLKHGRGLNGHAQFVIRLVLLVTVTKSGQRNTLKHGQVFLGPWFQVFRFVVIVPLLRGWRKTEHRVEA